MIKYEIDGHILEFGYGSSSLDPWSGDYGKSLGVPLWTVNDMRAYVRLDGEEIYLLRGNRSIDLLTTLENNAVDNWEEFMYYYKDFFKEPRFRFSEEKMKLDKLKEKSYGTKETDSN